MACCFVIMTLLGASLCEMEPAQVTAYLQTLPSGSDSFETRFASVVRDSVGLTYVDGPLGEGPTGKYDTDPLIDLCRVDCVTFVEQSLALAASQTYAQAFDCLQHIRYRDGRIGFETRNHFMIADWLEANSWCRAVTPKGKSLTRTISKKDFFKRVKAPELGQDIPDRAVTLNYLPIDTDADTIKKLPTPSLVVFIGKIDWLFALHVGVLLEGTEGEGPRLYHASSSAKEVVATDFLSYCRGKETRYLGYAVYSPQAPPCTKP